MLGPTYFHTARLPRVYPLMGWIASVPGSTSQVERLMNFVFCLVWQAMTDEAKLAQMGYKQELRRSLSGACLHDESPITKPCQLPVGPARPWFQYPCKSNLPASLFALTCDMFYQMHILPGERPSGPC